MIYSTNITCPLIYCCSDGLFFYFICFGRWWSNLCLFPFQICTIIGFDDRWDITNLEANNQLLNSHMQNWTDFYSIGGWGAQGHNRSNITHPYHVHQQWIRVSIFFIPLISRRHTPVIFPTTCHIFKCLNVSCFRVLYLSIPRTL